MPGLIVFDVDGTILDSYTLFERAIAHYSEKNGMPFPDYEAIRHGYSSPMAFDFKWGIPREHQEKHLGSVFTLVDQWSMAGEADKTPLLFHGVEEALLRLRDNGHRLAIVTSKPEAPLLHLLEQHGVHNLFEAHRTWDDIIRRKEKEKPEPDMLLSVMRQLDADPRETVMVGDTIMDVKMGRAANTHTIGVAWGMHPVQHLIDAGAHHIIDSPFTQIVPVVKKIFA